MVRVLRRYFHVCIFHVCFHIHFPGYGDIDLLWRTLDRVGEPGGCHFSHLLVNIAGLGSKGFNTVLTG